MNAAKRTITGIMMAVAMLVVSNAWAGDLTPSGDPGSTMHTLEEIYNKINESSAENPDIPSESIFDVSTGMFAKFTGNTQGEIQGNCTLAGRTNRVMITGFSHKIEVPVDPNTGLPTGTRLHRPLTLIAYRDRAMPKLFQALCTGEILQVEIQFWREDHAGNEEHYFTIKIEDAQPVAGESIHPYKEAWSFTYSKIIWTHEIEGIETVDDWAKPVT